MALMSEKAALGLLIALGLMMPRTFHLVLPLAVTLIVGPHALLQSRTC